MSTGQGAVEGNHGDGVTLAVCDRLYGIWQTLWYMTDSMVYPRMGSVVQAREVSTPPTFLCVCCTDVHV